MRIEIIAVVAVLVLCQHLHGSTWVGNGGNAGDVEIAVVTRQLRKVFSDIEGRNKERALCECSDQFSDRSICDYLNKLSKAQVKFCSEELAKRARELDELVNGDKAVRLRWIQESMNVVESGQMRAVDAVANRERHEIVVNLSRFMELKSFDRLFLLTHELAHFTNHDGTPLTDEGSIGPFVGPDGAKNFINAMAAGAVMEAYDNRLIEKYQTPLTRPQGWKKWWLGFDGGSAGFREDHSSRYAIQRFARSGAYLRYHFGAIGLVFSVKNYRASKDFLSADSHVEESITAIGAGLAYRIFPFSDPLTYFGQTHFVIQALVEGLATKYKVYDAWQSTEDAASALGGSFGCSYYMPITHGFWFQIGGAYEVQNYRYSNVNLKYDTNKLSSFVGVSYAF